LIDSHVKKLKREHEEVRAKRNEKVKHGVHAQRLTGPRCCARCARIFANHESADADTDHQNARVHQPHGQGCILVVGRYARVAARQVEGERAHHSRHLRDRGCQHHQPRLRDDEAHG
jgi:hypothetical protein